MQETMTYDIDKYFHCNQSYNCMYLEQYKL